MQAMGKYYCCITDCHNYSGRSGKFGKNVTLHKLPKETATRRAWIRSISRKNWKPSSYTRVCSDHFQNGIGPDYLNRLKVPTENLPQKKKIIDRTPRKAPKRRRLSDGNNTRNEEATSTTTVSSDAVDMYISQDDVVLEEIHSYAQSGSGIEVLQKDTCNKQGDTGKATQTNQEVYSDRGANISLPELVIEDIKDSNESIMFYTGLPNYMIFNALFESLMQSGAENLSTEALGEFSNSSIGRKKKLRRVDEFLLVLVRLRLGLLVKDLEFRFKVSASTVSKIFSVWITFMYECMQSMVFLPELDVLKLRIPKCFQSFSDTRIVLDCTEIFVQTPSSLECKSITYSNYKSHNTFKALVGISMTGAVVFVSKLWGGSASDVEITRQSGLLNVLKSGDAVMVDKGFIHLQQDLKNKGVKLYCPPFKTKEQFSKFEVETTRRIASARIHVERKMEQIKNFRILQGVMPLALSKIADKIFFVCAAMTNLLPPLVS